jgi:CheY-like chemotaxis protein
VSVSILVVDDEPDVAELFRQRFRRETRQGTYVLHYAASGADALERLATEIEPTLIAVLSDINMPGMDGLQLLAEIKQRRPDLTVMMVTAYGDEERRRGFVTVTNVGLEGAGAELDLTSLRRRLASALPPRLERPAASIGR